VTVTELKPKTAFFVRTVKNWKSQVKTVLPSNVCIYIVSNSMNRRTDRRTNTHGNNVQRERRHRRHVDVWCHCNLWTVSRKTDGRTGIELGAF